MDYDKLDLRNKTFLDFTTDEAVIRKILGGYSRESFLEIVEYTPALRWNTFLKFADLSADETLAGRIRELARPEMVSLFDE